MTRYNERTDLTKRDLIDLARGFELLGDQLRRHAAMLEEFGREKITPRYVASAESGMKKLSAFMEGIAEAVVKEVGRPLENIVANYSADKLAKEVAIERHKFLVEQSAIAAREKMDAEIEEAGTPGGKTYIASVVVISALYLLSIGSFGVGILVFIGSFGVWYHARTAERLMAVLVGSGSFFVMAVLFAFAAECFLILIDIRKDSPKS